MENIAQLEDERQVYVRHIQDDNLHGIVLNKCAMAKLKSAIENCMALTSEFKNFINEDKKDPMTIDACGRVLCAWLETKMLVPTRCQHMSAADDKTMQEMAKIGCAFIPADLSYWIGWCILHLLHIIDETFAILPQMLSGLPTNPNDWINVKDPFPEYLRRTTDALSDITSVFIGYKYYIRSHYSKLALILQTSDSEKWEKNDEATLPCIIGDCNHEFWMALANRTPNRGYVGIKRNCKNIVRGPVVQLSQKQYRQLFS